MFTEEKIRSKVAELRKLPLETEWFEFKESKEDQDFRKIGKCFSALANEANLNNQTNGWLVFGIRDKDRKIVGSDYRKNDRNHLDSLKGEIANKNKQGHTFVAIYELKYPEGRVVVFQVPPAPRGIPIDFEGHYYGRVFGRNGPEQVPLSEEKRNRIRAQSNIDDWSAGIVENATIDDLYPEAIQKARANYKIKYPNKTDEVDSWNDISFLNKAKVTIKNQITRTAIILLGREESEHFVNPAEIKIRWILKDAHNQEKDYDMFSCPLILAVDKVFSKIRNIKYRYLKDGTLFPDEVLTYEPFIIREALNNCIAHQDYPKSGRINVVEKENGELVFTNYGQFIPKSVEHVVIDDAPEELYRNKFLATAMLNLNMVETVGGGIKKMFNFQKARFFPLPEYDLSGNKVKLTIIGKVLDVEFVRVLANNPALTLQEIIALDKVQKKKRLTKEETSHLRQLGFIEGRKPNFYISDKVISKTADSNLKADYIKNRPFDDEHYKRMILGYLKKFGHATRQDLNRLLFDKLSGVLSDKQKHNKIMNLRNALKSKGLIINKGTDRKPKWVLINKGNL
jgi:ATP-dependent DNA helicase RecG